MINNTVLLTAVNRKRFLHILHLFTLKNNEQRNNESFICRTFKACFWNPCSTTPPFLQRKLELVLVAVQMSASTSASSGWDARKTFIFTGSVHSCLAYARHDLELLVLLHKWLRWIFLHRHPLQPNKDNHVAVVRNYMHLNCNSIELKFLWITWAASISMCCFWMEDERGWSMHTKNRSDFVKNELWICLCTNRKTVILFIVGKGVQSMEVKLCGIELQLRIN